MGVKLVSASGGSVEINPPATASSFTATMPAGTGNVVVAGINSAITAATAQASTSGTSIDFTGIPSWVKRVTVMFSGVSTNGTSLLLVRLGTSGGVVTTGYDSTVSASTTAGTFQSSTVGMLVVHIVAANSAQKGAMTLLNITGNTWVAMGAVSDSVSNGTTSAISGTVTLSGTLTQVRITTVNGTDTFDAGTINILYE